MSSTALRILQMAPRVGVLRSLLTWGTKLFLKKHGHRLPNDFSMGAQWLFIKSHTGNCTWEGKPAFRVSTTSIWFASRLTGISLTIDGRIYKPGEMVLQAGEASYDVDKLDKLPLVPGRTYSVIVPGLTLPDGLHFIDLRLKTDLQDFDYTGVPIILEKGSGGVPEIKAMESTIKPGEKFTAHYSPHIHYDVEWIFDREKFLQVGARNLLDAIAIMEKDPGHTFILDQAPHVEPFFELLPEEGEKIKKWAYEGRIEATNGLWAEPDVNLVGGEALVRSSIMWQKFAQKHFGQHSKVGWFIDAFGQSAQIPQILAKSGTPYFAFSRIIEDPDHPTEFWWQSPDGSRVLAHHMKFMYNIGYPIMEEPKLAKDRFKYTLGLLARVRTSDNIFYPAGVDHGRPLPFATDRIKEWNDENPNTPIEKSTPSKFFESLDTSSLRTVKGEFQRDLWGVYSSRIKGKIQNRRVELKVLHAETWATIAAMHGFEYPANVLEEQWKEIFNNQFHDCICGCSSDNVMDGIERRLHTVEEVLDGIRDDAQRFIAGRVTQNSPVEGAIPIVVFNPLSWKRDDLIEGNVLLPPGMGDVELVDEDGKAIITQDLDRHFYLDGNTLELRFLWRAELPPLGWRTFYLAPSPSGKSRHADPKDRSTYSDKKCRLISDRVIVHIDPVTGLLRTVEDKARGNHFKPMKGNQLIHQRDMGTLYNPVIIGGGKRSGGKTKTGIRTVENGPLRASIEVEGKLDGNPYTQLISVTEGSPRVDFKTDVNMGTRQRRLRVAFPPAMKGAWRHGIPYGHIERPRHELAARDWADLSDEKAGMTLIQFGTPGMSLEKGEMTISLWRSTNLIHFIPAGEGAFSLGEHSFKYALYPHGPFGEARPRRYAREHHEPPLMVRAHGSGGDLPGRLSIIDVDNDHLTVEALYREGDEIVVRLLECCGEKGSARATLGFDVKSAALTDLIANMEQSLEVKGRNVEIPYGPFQIITMRLTI